MCCDRLVVDTEVALQETAQMKLFVINLARRKERMSFMEKQFASLDLAFERIDAVDGERLTPDERHKAILGFRWWCSQGYKARAGEIGCALSHRKVLAIVAGGDLPCACIMEDDVTLGDEFRSTLEAAKIFVIDSAEPKVVLLTPCEAAKGEGFVRIPWAQSCGCYVVNKEAAKRILVVTSPLTSTIDDWQRWSEKGKFAIYAACPAVCSQAPYGSEPFDSPFASDTRDKDTVFVSEMKPMQRFCHKCLRIVGRTLDRLLP